jgi:hypothetical protein
MDPLPRKDTPQEDRMVLSDKIPEEIVSVGETFSKALAGLSGHEAFIDYVSRKFYELNNRPLISGILQNLVRGVRYPDVHEATLFDNEFLLYADSRQLFTLLLFLWEPGVFTPVHDHNAWGVIGPICGELEVCRFRRDDDGSREGYARLSQIDKRHLAPGDTSSTLPLDKGIHRVGNTTREITISLSIYGRPTPRGYIHEFDVTRREVSRRLAPSVRKKTLARLALRRIAAETRPADTKDTGF